MKIKALVSFSGVFSMAKDEVMEYNDKAVLHSLLRFGYIEEVKDEKKDVKSDESKRDNNTGSKKLRKN